MMNDKMKKLIDSKKAAGKGINGVEKAAKSHVIGAMKQMANDEINDRLGGLKKVSVMSDSKDGLEHGLDKAKDILGHSPMPSDEGDDSHEMMDEDMDGLEEDAGEDLDHDGEAGEDAEHIEKVMGNGRHHGMGAMTDTDLGGESADHELNDEMIDSKIKDLLMKKEQLKAKKMR